MVAEGRRHALSEGGFLMRSKLVLAFAFLLAMAPAVPASGDTGDWDVETIATGLDNPRGVSVGASGAIYVAESGSGGPTFVPDGSFGGTPAPGCVGESGAITKVSDGNVERIATLPSAAEAFDPDGPGPLEPTCDGPIGFAAVGPSNVTERHRGRVDVAMGLGGNEALQTAFGEDFGSLVRVFPSGASRPVANIAAYEEANDPDGQGPDSNPYGLATLGTGRFVADAGANALFHVRPNGAISVAAVFPNLDPVPFTPPSCFGDLPPELQELFPPPGTPIPPNAVPTAVAAGPHGDLYVGILSGFPFGVGAAKVYRINTDTGRVGVLVDGLTHVTGIDFDDEGNLYVAQMTDVGLLELEICGSDAPGSVIKIDRNGNQEVIAQLPLIGDVAIDADGAVYVTYGSILPAFVGGGSLAKLTYNG